MRLLLRTHIATVLILSLFFFAAGQNQKISFERIQGLSNPMTTGILQDKEGFIWVSTWGGLNRYDGYDFKIYKTLDTDSTTLYSNAVIGMAEDKKGRIWIACNLGLNVYFKELDRFARIIVNKNDNTALTTRFLRCLFLDSKGILWLGTYFSGIYSLDINKISDFTNKELPFKHYTSDTTDKKTISGNYIRSFFEDKNSNIWISASTSSVDLFNRNKQCFTRYTMKFPDVDKMNNILNLLFEDSDSSFWFGTKGAGLFIWDRKNDGFYPLKSDAFNNSLSANIIRHIRKDNNGIYWISTDGGGITLFDKKKNLFTYIRYQTYDNNTLSSDAIYETLFEKSGTVWAATSNAGINKYDKSKSRFSFFKPDPFNRNSLNNKSVLSILEDNNGDLFIGTDGGGLNILNSKTNTFNYFTSDRKNKNAISSNAVICLAKDFQDNIWIGTYAGGLNCLNAKTRLIKCYINEPHNAYSISQNDIWSLFEDNKQNLWIGTLDGTLNLYDRLNDRFYRYKRDSTDITSFVEAYTTQIFEDSRHFLWIATSSGVDMLKLDECDFGKPHPKLKFIHFVHHKNKNSLSSNSIVSITEDSEGNMWFGSEEGIINKLDLKNNEFSYFTDKNELQNNSIRAITFDRSNNLWISSVNGLWKFIPAKKSFRKFDISDGLQDLSFSRAFYKSSNGTLYFGGVNGYNVFHPDSIKDNPYVPEVLLTDFLLFNKSAQVGEKNSILKQSITFTKELEIPFDQSVITFKFAALSYISQEKNQYAYMLEGFEKNWNYIGHKREATYTSLNPGIYTFRVKASNNDGIWNEKGTSLTVKILPPWWKTWWFRILAVALLICAVVSYYYIRLSLYRKRQKELKVLVEQRTMELKESNDQLYEQRTRLEEQAEELRVHNEHISKTNELLLEQQVRIERQSDEIFAKSDILKAVNDQLMERQSQIEEQTEELKTFTENLKEANDLLIEKQKLITYQTDQLIETNNKLSELNATKDKFFSIIAHDLRNPFNAIKGFTEVLIKKFDTLPADKIMKYLETIHVSTKSINDLLENLLQWAGSQNETVAYEPVHLNLKSIADENTKFFAGIATNKNISLKQLIDDHITVIADKEMLHTIFRNLISNAIKFTDENGTITLSARNLNMQVEITVSDTGVGIPEETISQLFRIDSTISTKGTANETGTGLGLILCREFVEKHNGKIWVESKEGEGSNFIFTIPKEQ
jgi:signal transduction histidine kinase/ligand-binding sensor domain-containing protein